MDPTTYNVLALLTEAPVTPELETRLVQHARGIHAYTGLLTEIGELADQFKRAIFYGKPLDVVNIEEEAGDLFWYCAILFDAYGLDFGRVMRKNIDKLQARFPNKFTEADAIERDTRSEREILESDPIVVALARMETWFQAERSEEGRAKMRNAVNVFIKTLQGS